MSSAVLAHLPQLGRPDAPPRLPANGRGRSTRFATPSSLTAGGSRYGTTKTMFVPGRRSLCACPYRFHLRDDQNWRCDRLAVIVPDH
jgi:hypothetical protein